MGTIPASQIVSVRPNVLPAGGSALDLIAVMLTTNTRVPIDTVQPFSTAADVGAYFGLSSNEFALATIYFNGFDNSNINPSKVYFAQYPQSAVAAFLRGGTLGLTLAQLKAVAPGALTISWNGTPQVSASIDLSGATSFSDAASLIQAAFTTPPFTVAYDSTRGAFLFVGSSTGSTHTVGFASANAISAALRLTSATGAVISQGADAATPGPFMDGVVEVTQDWATFMTCFDPDSEPGNSNKLLFAEWANSQANRFCYVCWDPDLSPSTDVPATGSLGYLIGTLGQNLTGICLIGGDGLPGSAAVSAGYAAFVCGAAASIDFSEHNGRITFAFKSQTGLQATCTNASAASNLIANGYNFYGAYATANDQFVFFNPGSVSGPFKWLDNFVDQIWLNNQLQLALMVLLTTVKSIPYNDAGGALIEAACQDVINEAVNFGAIRQGIRLSQAQIAEMNSAAGVRIDDTVTEQGWYLQVLAAQTDPQVRQARGSPPCSLFYSDGESVQKISLVSTDIL